MTSIDKYLFQAMDSYPYSLEETLESLDYALSYDENNTMALCLYGRLYSEQLQKFDIAKSYFQKALSIDIQALEVYPYYIEALLFNEDYEEADTLIEFALKIKGINKIEIKLKEVLLHEMQQDLLKALELAKLLKLYVFNSEWNTVIEETEKRLKQKKKILFGEPKKKKKEKKKENSDVETKEKEAK
ncbi:hypothetical protein SAMN05216480_102131 [Pustulibacterium marinum]|uniref:Uncharacterized protein n=1 Tax=Pustulibacterium marinum TaxID=1224947 RepID=A0A1I7FQU8_9FLAO|nr:hypothetical protein [Pustulibacterium marinum]SFU38528.1 hypothetical protein SAMN05216480_102131 [Pustulibacterium marinum]